MSRKPLCLPDETILARNDGAVLYARDVREEYPLYRGLYLVTTAPFVGGRRRAHLTFICHLGRLRAGGDCWRLTQTRPELIQWIEAECREVFDRGYLLDTFGYSEAELDSLIASEREKYGTE